LEAIPFLPMSLGFPPQLLDETSFALLFVKIE
jgi:hypothetical protein